MQKNDRKYLRGREMKIAKILLGNPDNKKGFFNNVMERTKHLMEMEPNVDCYMLRLEYGLVLRLLKRQFRKPIREDFSIVDGVQFKNLWVTMGVFDYLITHRFHRRVIVGIKQLDKYISLFEGYDLLSTHGMDANFLSTQVKRRYKVPFVATWHGSEINVTPFKSTIIKTEVAQLLDAANHNIFVSQRLLETSNEISAEAIKSVLYTGPAKFFYRYSGEQRQALREKYNIKTKYVVGFIGNFVAIKNVLVLPSIFKKLQNETQDIGFVIVGNGEIGSQLSSELNNEGIKHLHMLGKQEPSKISEIMNCLDVLVLPSLNEGLPVVTLEAQACGVHVVGSNRGGIPESIGYENCFELDKDFIVNISARIMELLQGKVELPVLADKFSWSKALEKELIVYKNIEYKDFRGKR
jgi:glycosyltransferase involved in cell wall biosynthesis